MMVLVVSSTSAVNWDNGGEDELWSTAANWQGDSKPTSTDIAVVNAGNAATVTTEELVGRMNIGSGSSAGESSLTIASGGSLTFQDAGSMLLRQQWGAGSAGGNSIITVDGGTLSVVKGVQAGNNAGQDATFKVINGGTANIGDKFNYTNSAADAGRTVLVDGTGSTLTVNEMLLNGTNAGTLTISNGGTFTAAKGTISGVVSGDGNFVMDGAGNTLIVSGVNTFSGSTTVSNGTIQAQSTSAFGTSATTVASGGVIQLNGNNNTVGSLGGAGVIENANATAAILTTGADNSSTTFSGVLQDGTGGGALSLTKNGAGTQSLTGANTYTGDTVVNGGELTITDIESNTYSGAVIVNGGTLREVFTSTGHEQTSNTTDYARSASSTTINDSGTLVLDTSSFTEIRSRPNIGSITVNSGGTLNIHHDSTNTGEDKLIVTGGAITGDGILRKTGGAYFDIAWGGSRDSLHNFSGVINVDEGSLAVNTNRGVAKGNGDIDLTVAADATFDVRSGVLVMDALSGAGTIGNSGRNHLVTYDRDGLIVGNDDGDGTFSGSFTERSGNLGFFFTKNGTGKQILSGSNGPSGTITLNGGILQSAATGALGTENGDIIFNGGTLQYGGGNTEDYSARVATSTGAVSVDTNGETVTWASAIGDNNTGLTKGGTGSLILTGANTYTGTTTLNGGELQANIADVASTSGALGNGGTITFGGGTLQYGAGITDDYSSRVANSTGAVSVDTNGETITWASTIDDTNTGGLAKSGTGSLILTGANTYTGITALNGGELQVNVADVASTSGALGNGGTITFGGGTLQYGAGITDDYSSRVANSTGAISVDTNGETIVWASALDATNTGGLIKGGAGSLALSGANAYTGATDVQAGTLTVGSSTALGVSLATTVASGALLGLDGNSISIGSLAGAGTIENANIASSTLTTGGDDSSTTFSGVLQDGTGGGALSVTKVGSGTQEFTGSNSYSGNTVVSAGTLKVTSQYSLGDSVGTTTISNGATLALDYGPSVKEAQIVEDLSIIGTGIGGTEGALKITRTGKADEYRGTITLAGDATINTAQRWDTRADISDDGNGYTLTKTGSNIWRNNATQFSANLVVAEGRYVVLTNGALPLAVTVKSGAQLDTFFGGLSTVLDANGLGTVTFEDNSSFLVDRGSGASTGVTLGSSLVLEGSTTFMHNGLGGHAIFTGDISGAGGLTLTSGQSTLGPMTFSGTNTYSGATVVGDGSDGTGKQILNAGSTGALSSTSDFTVTANSSLNLNGNSNTIGSLNGAGIVTSDGDATLTLGNTNSDGTFTGTLQNGESGKLTLVKLGTGNQTLSGSQTYTGRTTLGVSSESGSAGTLTLTDSSQATEKFWFEQGGTLNLGADALTIDRDFFVGSRPSTVARTIQLDLDGTTTGIVSGAIDQREGDAGMFAFNVGTDDTLSATGAITNVAGGGAGLTKVGAGTLVLSGDNSYMGDTTLSVGTLELASATAAGTGAINQADASSLMRFNTTGEITNDMSLYNFESLQTVLLSGDVVAENAAYLIADGTTTTFSGAISGSGFSASGTGTLVLAGTNNSTGTTSVSSNLEVGSEGALSDSAVLEIATGATVKLNGYNSSIGSLKGAGVIKGAAALTTGGDNLNSVFAGQIKDSDGGGALAFTKTGNGIQTLSGTNTYSGATDVTSGTLLVNGDNSGASGDVTIDSGAKLGGSGTIGGATTVSGTLAAGNSPGILTFNDALTLNAASVTEMEFALVGPIVRGEDYDGINVGGQLTYGGALKFLSDSSINVGTYDLFAINGTETGDFASVVLSGAAYADVALSLSSDVWTTSFNDFDYSFSQLTGDLTVAAAVPEPETFALLGGMLSLGYVMVRRRR
jgi:autotransporter-associated beta strand protein